MTSLLKLRPFSGLCQQYWKFNNFRHLSQAPLDVNTNVVKDVIMFKYENPRRFRAMNFFAICQFGFWTYLSVFSYTTLKDAPTEPSKEGDAWWRKINLGQNKYRNSFALFSFIIGYGMLCAVWIYTLRSVRFLVLLKGGKSIGVVTYTPFGVNKIFKVPLHNVSAKNTRSGAKSLLPIKINGHYLHYLLDMDGEFKNPELFDHTAGLKRTFTKQ